MRWTESFADHNSKLLAKEVGSHAKNTDIRQPIRVHIADRFLYVHLRVLLDDLEERKPFLDK